VSTVNPTARHCYSFDHDAFVEAGRPEFRRSVIMGQRIELWCWRIAGAAAGATGSCTGNGRPITPPSRVTMAPRHHVRLHRPGGAGGGAAVEPQAGAGT
jgi:hypothetical protein